MEFSYSRAMLGDRKGPTMKPTSKSGPAADSKNASAGIPELIAALATSSPVARKKAREALVALGGPAVPALSNCYRTVSHTCDGRRPRHSALSPIQLPLLRWSML